jgi:hypothetical protein
VSWFAAVRESPRSPSRQIGSFSAVVRALQKRRESEGYCAGVAKSLAAAFPVSECGSFAGLLDAIDEVEKRREE